MTAYKQVILVRHDLKLPKGKMATQSAHASVEATLKAPSEKVRKWRSEGMKKVIVKVADQKELYKYVQMAKDEGMTTAVITDAGKTVIAPGTVTCAAIGPDDEERVDRLTSELKLV